MSYSFSDPEEEDVCRQTMMVPFVDLLNHHSSHQAELRFLSTHLQLVAVTHIPQVRLTVAGVTEHYIFQRTNL